MNRMKAHLKVFAILIIAIFANAHQAHAIVACPDPAIIQQPDGSKLTLMLHGDEWFNYNTTHDGYTVVKDVDGYYKYAVLQNNQLSASTIVAHDKALRNASELIFLATTKQHLTPDAATIAAKRAPARKLHGHNGHYDYGNFRGLVILVAYQDCPFQYENAHDLFNGLVNDKDYKGFMSDAMFPELIPYTGSVRDYFYASSNGLFDPAFDVVGPVTINYTQYEALKTSNAQALVSAALDAANDLVNYKDYDRDGNGKVDMVYFIFAGAGSNFSGNDQRLLWPHASSVLSKSLDGVSFDRYACSTELFSRPESRIIDGIGSMCHEFSHVLGIADLYDTDGTSSGGSSDNPQNWSIMAHGNYLNQSRTPCLYSAYERYAAGFTTLQNITQKGTYTLQPITATGTGYRLDSSVKGEYFILENRVKSGWDAYLPGEGMLVWRVDSTDVDAWENNKVNCNPAHPLYQLVRAGGGTKDTSADPFPGTAGITAIDNNTTPSLRSWTGRKGNYGISGIARNSDGTVSFKLTVTNYEDLVEDFEDMALTTADAKGVQGKFTKWDFTKGALVAEAGSENAGNGKHACSMTRSSELISGRLTFDAQSFAYDFYNPTSSAIVVRTYYRNSGSTTWLTLKNDQGLESMSVPANSKVTFNSDAEFAEGTQFRIVEYSGKTGAVYYLDDITFSTIAAEPTVTGDVNGDGVVDIADINAIINAILTSEKPNTCDVNGDGVIDIADVNTVINIILNK